MKIVFRFVSIFLFLATICGCAQLVTKTYSPQKGGVVKYSETLFIADKNRAKALELADDHCRPGRAVVLQEDNRTEFTGNSSTQGQVKGNTYNSQTTQGRESAVYIKFRCR